MIRRFTRAAVLGAAVAMLAAGCAVATSQHDTSLQLSIEDAPVGVSCARLKIEGQSEEWRLFDIHDGVAPSFGLTGIRPGLATVTVTGFDVACRDVSPFLAPVWTSDPVHVDVGRLPNQQLRVKLYQATGAFLSAVATRAGILIRFIERSGTSTSPDGGASAGADTGTSAPPGTVCQGAACVTVGEPPDGGVPVTGEGGVGTEPDASLEGGSLEGGSSTDASVGASGDGGVAPPFRCVGSLCLVPELEGGAPPGSFFCADGVCLAPRQASSPEAGTDLDSGAAPEPTRLCFGAVCAVFIDRGSPDAGVPGFGTDGGAAGSSPGSSVCADGICVFSPGNDGDAGFTGGRPLLPLAICSADTCVILEPNDTSDGGVAIQPGGSPDATAPPPRMPPTTICFGATCVSLSPTAGDSDGGARLP
jgi:hypothetical protein